MTNEEVNKALYDKMSAEQNKYKDWLMSLPPKEILGHSYEFSMREEILIGMEYIELSSAQANALRASPSPLADIYKDFSNLDAPHLDMIREVIEVRADENISREKERLLNTPVYLQSGDHAAYHGESDSFIASYKANISCKEALEESISKNYSDNSLNLAAVYEDVVGRFGAERVKLVLAATLQHSPWEMRFSHANKEWANTVPMEAGFGSKNADRSFAYMITQSHPGLTNMLVTHFREEQEKERAQANGKQTAEKAKPSIRQQLAAAKAAQAERPSPQQHQKDKGAR